MAKNEVRMVQRHLKNSTQKVAEAVQKALMEHAHLKKAVMTSEGILLALMDQKDSIVIKILNEMPMDAAPIRVEIQNKILSAINDLPEFDEGRVTQMQISQDVKNLFEAGDREKKRLGDSFISTGGMFLAAFDNSVPNTERILRQAGLNYDTCARALDTIRGHTKVTDKEGESRRSLMEEYTVDLTAQARRGNLDPVVCRDAEINQVIQILSRRKKNNPLLIGEPGVGKTVIVEGLALRIASADVPDHLLDKRVLSLEMGGLLAGAKLQGEFEERLKSIRDEVIASSGHIILFIDEIHTVVGAGRSSGSLDASNMLKPALAQGKLQCIGATTLKEYKQYIEPDKALARRFQTIKIDEPSVESTIEILKQIKDKYQAHHQVEYMPDAIEAAATLAKRYITERFLPDKAIDLLDASGAAKRLKMIYAPPELRDLERGRHGLMEKKSQAFNEQDFESMAAFQMELAQLEDRIKSLKNQLNMDKDHDDNHVIQEDVAHVVSEQTGIPLSKIVAQEAEKLNQLEIRLKKRVIGQDHAILSVANAIRRNRSGLKKSGKPIGSFLFLGPTGVGKTELAKAIAVEMLDDESRIIRVDMSEYMERHDVSKLIGSPPGYVGYGEGGQLTEQVKRQPYSVVLFDEFEKAHIEVFNILLQVLDEGWLTDGEGQKVSFSNCVIIGTSNIGSDLMSNKRNTIGIGAQVNEWSKDDLSKAMFKEMKNYFRPEFINRLDEVIIFNGLAGEQFGEILEIMLTDLCSRLQHMGLEFTVSAAAKKGIIAEIETDSFGARPLKRKIEALIENPIASKIVRAEAKSIKTVCVEVNAGKIEVLFH